MLLILSKSLNHDKVMFREGDGSLVAEIFHVAAMLLKPLKMLIPADPVIRVMLKVPISDPAGRLTPRKFNAVVPTVRGSISVYPIILLVDVSEGAEAVVEKRSRADALVVRLPSVKTASFTVMSWLPSAAPFALNIVIRLITGDETKIEFPRVMVGPAA